MPNAKAFDRLTELVAALFDAPIALITVLDEDRQWFRSNRGYHADHTTRDESFCAHMLGEPSAATLVVEDATTDPRFCANRLVTEEGVRFYAGALITTADGGQHGAVCVIDTVSRAAPTEAQMESLKLLAWLAGQEIDQNQLLRRQAKHAAMLEMAEELAGLGRWRFDLATGKVDWSDEVYRIHGRDRAIYDPSYADLLADYHPEDREILSACVERAIATGQGYNLDLRLSLAERGERWVTTRARTECDETGRAVALYGVFQDVTDTVRAQERIERSEALFRLMSDNSTDIIARFDPAGRFLYVSPAVKTVLGRDPEDMLGKDCSDFIPPDDLKMIRSTLRAYVEAGPEAPTPRYEYRAIRSDGSLAWLEAAPRAVRDASGAMVEFHDHVRDITTRKDAERAQTELVETLSMAEELGGVGSWRLDVASGAVTWSDEVYRIHGKSRDTFDPSFDDAVGCYHPDDRQTVADVCRQAIETGIGGGSSFASSARMGKSGRYRPTAARSAMERARSSPCSASSRT